MVIKCDALWSKWSHERKTWSLVRWYDDARVAIIHHRQRHRRHISRTCVCVMLVWRLLLLVKHETRSKSICSSSDVSDASRRSRIVASSSSSSSDGAWVESWLDGWAAVHSADGVQSHKDVGCRYTEDTGSYVVSVKPYAPHCDMFWCTR